MRAGERGERKERERRDQYGVTNLVKSPLHWTEPSDPTLVARVSGGRDSWVTGWRTDWRTD